MPHPKVKIADNSGNEVAVTSNALDVNIAGGASHAAVDAFTQNVTDSAVILTTKICKHADIMATIANTGIVYIGIAGVSTTTGIALYPGDVYSIDIERTNLLYCISTVSGDDINVVTYS